MAKEKMFDFCTECRKETSYKLRKKTVQKIKYEKSIFDTSPGVGVAGVLQYLQGDSLLSRHCGEPARSHCGRKRHHRAAQGPDFHHGIQ